MLKIGRSECLYIICLFVTRSYSALLSYTKELVYNFRAVPQGEGKIIILAWAKNKAGTMYCLKFLVFKYKDGKR